jgi:hypothetical protein
MADYLYADWIGIADLTARRARLVLHLVEVANDIRKFQNLAGEGHSASRFNPQPYYDGLRDDLAQLNRALGFAFNADVPAFVAVTPELRAGS